MFHNDDFSQVAAAVSVFAENNLEGKSGYIPGDKLGRMFQNMNGKAYEPKGCKFVLEAQKDVLKEILVGLRQNTFEMNENTAVNLVAAFIPAIAKQMKEFSQVLTDEQLRKIPLEGKMKKEEKSQNDLDLMRRFTVGGLGFSLSQRLLLNDPDACRVDGNPMGELYDPAVKLVYLLGQICTNYADQIMQFDQKNDNGNAIATYCIRELQALDVKDPNNNAALRILDKCGIRNSLQIAEAEQKRVDVEKARAGEPAKLGKSMHIFGAAEKARPEEHWQAESAEIKQAVKPATAPARLQADVPKKGLLEKVGGIFKSKTETTLKKRDPAPGDSVESKKSGPKG